MLDSCVYKYVEFIKLKMLREENCKIIKVLILKI